MTSLGETATGTSNDSFLAALTISVGLTDFFSSDGSQEDFSLRMAEIRGVEWSEKLAVLRPRRFLWVTNGWMGELPLIKLGSIAMSMECFRDDSEFFSEIS